MKRLVLFISATLLLLLNQYVAAQSCQNSNAGAATYNSSFSNGQNDNSTGFGNWILSGSASSGFFVASSSNNDAGTPGLPNINTSGRSWGLWANGGQTSSAVRPFTTALQIGHSISCSMDNGSINSGGPTVGIGLQNSSGENLMEFYFRGGQSNYELNDGTAINTATGLGYTRGGIDLTITRTGTGSYSVSITRKENNQTVNFTRNFFSAGGGQTPDRIRFFNYNAGSGGDFDAFFNNITICKPVITATGTLSALTTTYGAASSTTSFTVSGTSMYTGITVAAPAGFEVSTSAGSGYSSSIVVGTSGTISSTTVYVRLAATTAFGSYSGNITCSSTGASNATVATVSSSVSKAPLTINGVTANNKQYDGTTTATLAGTATYQGLQNSENFSVTGTPAANFSSASVGTNKVVTVTGYTAPSANYSVSQPAGLTANITGLPQASADYRTQASGNFNAASTWQYDQGGNDWIAATQAPTSANNLAVQNGHTLTLNTNLQVANGKSLSLNATSNLIVSAGTVLSVASGGTISLNGQSVTLKSSASGTASIGQIQGTLSGATNVTVERYIPANEKRAWRLLSVPTTGSQTIRQAWQEGDVNTTPLSNNLPGYGTLITAVGASAAAVNALGFDANTPGASMQSYNGSAWVSVANTNTANIATTGGYFLYIRGDRSATVNTTVTNNSTPTVLRTKGTIYQGTQVVNAPTAFSVIGNIYPSSVDFSQLTRGGSVSNLYYLWDAKKVSGSSLGGYQTFSAVTGYSAVPGGGSFTPGQVNTTIQSGQAFFVSGIGSVTFNESAKVGTSATTGFRPAVPAESLVKLDTRLKDAATGAVIDGNAIVFDPAYSNSVDADDARKMNNPVENFSIVSGTDLLIIEARQPLSGNETIQFNMQQMQEKAYQLEVAAQHLSNGQTAVLTDRYTNSQTALNLDAVTTYNFNVTADAASKAADRFYISFRTGNALPVQFISVNAQRQNNLVDVRFTVAAERAVREYVIERSVDGRNFAAAGTIQAGTNSDLNRTYQFADVSAPTAVVFYRIRSIDQNGAIKLSQVVRLQAGSVKPAFQIAPNPVVGTSIQLQLVGQSAGTYQFRLMSQDGKVIQTQLIRHAGGSMNQTFNLPAGLTAGTYQAELRAANGTRQVLPLVISE